MAKLPESPFLAIDLVPIARVPSPPFLLRGFLALLFCSNILDLLLKSCYNLRKLVKGFLHLTREAPCFHLKFEHSLCNSELASDEEKKKLFCVLAQDQILYQIG